MQVLVPKQENLLGKMVDVRIVSAGKHFLKAELLTSGEVKRPRNVPAPLAKGQISGLTRTVTSHPLWVKLSLGGAGVALLAKVLIYLLKKR